MVVRPVSQAHLSAGFHCWRNILMSLIERVLSDIA